MPTSPEQRLLAVGAHPDDIEFGCGGILLEEVSRGATIAWVVCSRGEAGTHGTPELRTEECEAAARLCNASVQWLEMGGDVHLEDTTENAIKVARVIREFRPRVVLAPTLMTNQHPDHHAVGRVVQRAARLARYGGLAELAGLSPHAIEALLHYRITPSAAPRGETELVIDVSKVVASWEQMMRCHQSQLRTRDYVELQLSASRLLGLECGCSHAQLLYSQDAVVLSGLHCLTGSKRHF